MDNQAAPWYESNMVWGPVALASGIVLAVVAAMKHDLRWLLLGLLGHVLVSLFGG